MVTNIDKDFDELKTTWSTLSTPGKVFIVTSMMMTFMSVTSLADHVFELKGFLLYGLEFYHVVVKTVFSFINLDVPRALRDLIVLVSFTLPPIIRFERERNAEVAHLLDWGRIVFIFINLLMLPVAIRYYIGWDSNSTINKLGAGIVLAFYIYWFLQEQKRYRVFVNVLKHILTFLLILAVLAAISHGLARPLEQG